MPRTFVIVLAAAIAIAASSPGIVARSDGQRRQPPPKTDEPAQPAQPSEEPRATERQRRPPEGEPPGRAQPRPDSDRQRESPPPRTDRPRHPSPPPRAIPPRYYGFPRAYYFPPVSLQRGFYYHPYFGFYYGPYYGPFYPYPGPFAGQLPYGTSALRTRVKPVETEVYVNGYYAGIVDDFDGVFQRLYLAAGRNDLELHLNGYRSYRQKVYANPGDTLEITHAMQPLGPGERSEPAPSPQAPPREWTDAPTPAGDRPASPFGILAIRVEPADAQVFLDEDAWAMGARAELVIHEDAGWHRLEVRKEGYQTFRTEVELSEGVTTRLNVTLTP
jgi:hypothetical protein